ncbi:MAG: phosphohistidine phosphatase SixA [Deltaproteobacteria bacterium]|nr:phosphohistidine phosphatase SixA [Deltaproteobacteria bacterium]
MALYLVQHGQSLPKEIDPERSLSVEGKSTVDRIAKVASGYRVHVSLIQHSGKARARQTAEIMASHLHPIGGLQESAGLNPNDDVEAVAEAISGDENVMLVGHLPFMEKIVSYLVAGSSDKRIFKFQNGGNVCLNRDPEENSWYIKWTLMPQIA